MAEATKICSKCGECKPLDAFHHRPRNRHQREAHCKSCHNEMARQWRLRNPDKLGAIKRDYRERHRKPKPPSALETGLKICTKCGIEQPITAFGKHHKGRDGLRGECKKCFHASAPPYNSTKRREGYRRNRESELEYGRRYRLLNRFGLSLEEWEALFDLQGRICAICSSPTPRSSNWHTDHCHATGKVRGILCGPCNSGIGHLADSAERLQSAIAYLDRTQ